MNKILALLGAIIISGTTSNSLLTVKNHNVFNKISKINLETIIVNSSLGIIEDVTSQSILELVQFNNPTLDINEVEPIKISQTFATIVPLAESKVYEQNFGVQVTFAVQKKQQLKDIICQTNLGGIIDATSTSILNGLKNANPNLNLEAVNVRLNTITDESAIIQSKLDGEYKGEVLVHYTVGAKKIHQDLPNPNLGFLPNNDEITIFKALITANPNLIIDELKLKEISLSSVKLVVKENSTVYLTNDEELINFTTSPNSLKDDLTLTNLGELLNTSLKEITKSLKEKTKVQINEIRIFDITGFSFKIQAQANSHYYRVETPLIINFTLFKKLDLTDKVKFFKLVNYRNQDELIKKIKSKIGNKQIEYGKDFIIEGLEKNKKMPNNGLLTVKSTIDSDYLIGKFEFELISPINLTKYSQDSIEPIAYQPDKLIEFKILPKLKKEIAENKIDEDISKISSDFKCTYIKKYPFKHKNNVYLKAINFEINKNNPIFKNAIKWTNIKSPVYQTNEIKIKVDDTPMISFVDSTNDGNYPDNPPKKTPYVNKDHNPTRAYWETTDAVEFGRIYYRRDFNLDRNEFFETYKIRLNYKYSINGWCNKNGWKNTGGKNTCLISTSKYFTSSSETGSPKKNSTRKEYNADGYDHWDGDFNSKYKGAGAVQIYMTIDIEKIQIFGVAGSWFDWNNGAIYNHAGFARLRAESLKLIPIKNIT